MAHEVFISYRRSDSESFAPQIHDFLAREIGDRTAFMDVDSIPYGEDFREYLRGALTTCEVVLAVIGLEWAERLNDPADFVRVELEAALERGLPIIPVFVRGVSTVPARELPASLAPLAYRHGLPLRMGVDRASDLMRIGRAVADARERFRSRAQTTVAPPPPPPEPVPEAKGRGEERPGFRRVEVVGLSTSPSTGGAYALVLGEVAGDRRLPIIVGKFQAQAIAVELEGVKPPRPMTHDLLCDFFDVLEMEGEAVLIDDLKDGTFYAKMPLRCGGREEQIDMGPSDAVALAVRLNLPMYVADTVLDKAGIRVDASQAP